MKRLELIEHIVARKEHLNITIENLAKLSGIGIRTINRLLKNEDVNLSTVGAVTNVIGLDFAGNEQISLEELQKRRAKQKALYLASIVQGTSALEMQGLDTDSINKVIAMYENEFLYGNYKHTLWVA